MRRPHELVAIALVDPSSLRDLELALAAHDLWVWPVASSPVSGDGDREAFQLRRRLVEARRGEWDLAAEWVPVRISFGETWRRGDEPLPWAAHAALWDVLAGFAARVRHARRLEGVTPLRVRREVGSADLG